MQLGIRNYELGIPKQLSFILYLSSFIFSFFVVSGIVRSVHAQEKGAGIAVDSIHVEREYRDSLLKVDSLHHATMNRTEFAAESRKQLASQREVELTND